MKPADKDVGTTQGVKVGGESSSHVFQEHIPCRFVYKEVNSVDPNFLRPLIMYRGENAAEKFVCDWHLNSCLTSTLLLQNQCCLLLRNCDRLANLLPVIYAQNHLEMIKCVIIVTIYLLIYLIYLTSLKYKIASAS